MAEPSSASSRPHSALAAALAALLLAAVAALAGAPAAQAKTCSPFDLPGDGYITSLSVSHVGCTTGRKLANSYYRCRLKKGKAGRCTSKVMGYSCKETKRTKIPTEINARVTCTLGAKRIVHTYQQML
jgi:hypothetical protein